MAIILNDIVNVTDVSLINSNFQKIEDAINDNVVKRNIDVGEDNTLHTHLDMNSNRIVNVDDAVNNNDVPNLSQVLDKNEITAANAASAASSASEASDSADSAASSASSAATSADEAEDSAISAALSADEAKGYTGGISDLTQIARSLNVQDSEVIYSTDTTTVLDNVLYIYDATAQTVWAKPSSVGAGETIVSVVGSILTTTSSNYQLYHSDKETKKLGTLADLRSLSAPFKTVWLSGYHTADDSAFGSNLFKWDDTSVADDNGGTIIKLDSIVTGRYLLQYDSLLNVKWFGAKPEVGFDNYEAIQKALDYSAESGAGTFNERVPITNGGGVFFPTGEYETTYPLIIPPKFYGSIKGDGGGSIINKTTNLTDVDQDAGSPYNVDAIIILGNSGGSHYSLEMVELSLVSSGATKSTYGMYSQKMANSSFRNVRVYSVGTAFYGDDNWMINYTDVQVYDVDIGWDIRGGTSNVFIRCWVNLATTYAYSLAVVYSSMISCGADFIGDNSTYGVAYHLHDSCRISMMNCGAENLYGSIITASNFVKLSVDGFSGFQVFAFGSTSMIELTDEAFVSVGGICSFEYLNATASNFKLSVGPSARYFATSGNAEEALVGGDGTNSNILLMNPGKRSVIVGTSTHSGANASSAYGYSALAASDDNPFSTAIGNNSLQNIVGGSKNTAVGTNSFLDLTSGDSNVAVGFQAGQFSAGGNVTSADHCIAIGDSAQFLTPTPSNELVIGTATGHGDNTFTIGSTTQGLLYTNTSGDLVYRSPAGTITTLALN